MTNGSNEEYEVVANATIGISIPTWGSGSGVLIAPTIVLSAGHVADPGWGNPAVDPAKELPPFTGGPPFLVPLDDQIDWMDRFQWYRVSNTFKSQVIKVYFPRSRGDDAAVIEVTHVCWPSKVDMILFRLERAVSSEIAKPARVITSFESVNRNPVDYFRDKKVFCAGWGGGHDRRQVADFKHLQFPLDLATLPVQAKIQLQNGGTIEGGDSGGPVYYKNSDSQQRYVLGTIQGSGPDRYVATYAQTDSRTGGPRGPRDSMPDVGFWLKQQAFSGEETVFVDKYLDSKLNSASFVSQESSAVAISVNTYLVEMTGNVILDVRASGSSWESKKIEIDIALPGLNFIPDRKYLLLRSCSSFLSLSSFYAGANFTSLSNDGGFSIDHFTVVNAKERFSDYIRLRISVGVIGSGAFIYRVSYRILAIFEAVL